MKTVTIHIPENVPLQDIHAALRGIGLTLRQRTDGSLVGSPVDNVVHLPPRRRAHGSTHTPGPAA